MKKLISVKIVLIAIITLFATEIYSQGFYITAGAGYGLSPIANANGYEITTEHLQENYHLINGTDTVNTGHSIQTTNNNVIKGTSSYGKGVQIGATIGYNFTNNFGAELGISYLFGSNINSYKSTFTMKENDHYQDVNNPDNTFTTTSKSTFNDEKNYKGQMLRFIPAFKVAFGQGKLQPYMKLGLIVGITSKFNMNYDYTLTGSDGMVSTHKEITEYTGGITLGFTGGLGATYKLSNKIGIFAELGIIAQNWAPKKSELIQVIDDGVDALPLYNTSQKETEFVDEYTETYPSANTDLPKQSQKVTFPFSSIALNVGVSYAFGGK